MKPAHFLNLRWRQDYRFVTELRGRGVGPLEQVGLRLQQTKPDPWSLYEETIAGVGDIITLFGRKFLEFDGRRAVWQHSLVYPVGSLNRAAARGIFRAAYGGDPGLLLPILYELLAPLEHWEGDPLARRMFIGEAEPPPEPIAATLIRELWSSRLSSGAELALQLDGLEGVLKSAHARGVLDEPTEEERAAWPTARFVGEGAEDDVQSSGFGRPREDPSISASFAEAESASASPFVEVGPPAFEDLTPSLDGASKGWREPQDDLAAWPLSEPSAPAPSPAEPMSAESEVFEFVAAEHAMKALPEDTTRASSSEASYVESAAPEIAPRKAWSSQSREDIPFFEAVFRPPTDESAVEHEVDVLAEDVGTYTMKDDIAEQHVVPVQEEYAAHPISAALSNDDGDDEDDEDDEEDEKTVISPLATAQSDSSWRSDAEPPSNLLPPSALSEAETRLNIPVPTVAQLAALAAPPTAVHEVTTQSRDGELPPTQPPDEFKRPLIIGGLVGLIAALLALAIVWSRAAPSLPAKGGLELPTAHEQRAASPAAPVLSPAAPGGVDAIKDVARSEEGATEPLAGVVKGRCYTDKDQDGYGHKAPQDSLAGGECPAGTAPRGGDCNDNDSLVSPGAEELCDQRDNNCNPTVDDNDNLRDDNKDGKLDCLQTDPGAGMGRLKISGEVKGGANGQAPYLFIEVSLPEGSRGLCKQELRFGRGVSGSQTRQKFTYIAATQKCGVPVAGGALPRGLDPCVKGMSIAEKAEKVAVEAACCMQNQGSYGTYLTTKRVGDMESCEYLQTNSSINVKAGTALNLPLDPPPSSKPSVATPP